MQNPTLFVLPLLLALTAWGGSVAHAAHAKSAARHTHAASKALAPRPAPALTSAHLGVYRWGAPKGPKQVNEFAAWIGRPALWAEDFEPSDQWGNVSSPTSWMFQPWQGWVKEQKGRQLILTVPMLVGAWDGSGPATGPEAGKAVSLAKGATGAYNDYYKTLATNLVAYGLGDCYIRLGHKMNGGWYTWRASADPKIWPLCWRQIVTTMRAVPGTHFKFVWNPANGYLQIPAEQVYPGDAYVDVVGLDLYDQCWAANTYPLPKDATEADTAARRDLAWRETLRDGDHGLDFWYRFAQEHHKPFSIPEWGVCNRDDGHGGGDNAAFIACMAAWMKTHPTVFDVYFDVWAGDGNHQISPGTDGKDVTRFPLAAAKFKDLFGGPALKTASR